MAIYYTPIKCQFQCPVLIHISFYGYSYFSFKLFLAFMPTFLSITFESSKKHALSSFSLHFISYLQGKRQALVFTAGG